MYFAPQGDVGKDRRLYIELVLLTCTCMRPDTHYDLRLCYFSILSQPAQDNFSNWQNMGHETPEVMLQYHCEGSGFLISDYGEESRISSWSWNSNCYHTFVQKRNTDLTLAYKWLTCEPATCQTGLWSHTNQRQPGSLRWNTYIYIDECANLVNWLMTKHLYVGSNSTSSSINQQNYS